MNLRQNLLNNFGRYSQRRALPFALFMSSRRIKVLRALAFLSAAAFERCAKFFSGISCVSRYPLRLASSISEEPFSERMISVFHPGAFEHSHGNIGPFRGQIRANKAGMRNKRFNFRKGGVHLSAICFHDHDSGRRRGDVHTADAGDVHFSDNNAVNCRASRDQLQKRPIVRAIGSPKSSFPKGLMLIWATAVIWQGVPTTPSRVTVPTPDSMRPELAPP